MKNINTITMLTLRNIKIYLKDKATVFFSFLAPLIVIILYILFLKKLQIDGILAVMPEGVEAPKKAANALIDSWLIAGVLGVGIVTIAFNSLVVMVGDRQNKVTYDFVASPIKRTLVMFSYFLASFIVTVILCLLLFCVGLIYLAAMGSFYVSVANVFACIGTIILSSFTACLLMMIIAYFFKTQSGYGAAGGLFSAVIGFLIGAYMPISMYPKGLQYVSNSIPASHSSALLRNFLMEGTAKLFPAGLFDIFQEQYSFKLDLFGRSFGISGMFIYIACATVVLLGVNILIYSLNEKRV